MRDAFKLRELLRRRKPLRGESLKSVIHQRQQLFSRIRIAMLDG